MRSLQVPVLLLTLGFVAAGSFSGSKGGALWAAPEEPAVVVLRDGVELTGSIIEETDDHIVLRTLFGRSTIERARIREIRRGANPLRDEFQQRFERAIERRQVRELLDLARWAQDHQLAVESQRALQKVLEYDPDHADARQRLGHARLDGTWVDEKRVADLLTQGYVLEGLDLVRRAAAEGAQPAAGAGTTPVPAARVVKRPELTPEQKRAAEREREKRRKEAERFRRQKELEYAGVPWEKAHRIKTPHFEILCNSTEQVARTYYWILEGLYAELSRRFTQQHRRSQGRLPVFIYKTQDEFIQRTGADRGTGGFYRLDGSEQVHAFHGTFGLTGTTYSVLAHECTHQFQGRVLANFGYLPIWIIEGLAVYFGDGSKLDYEKKRIVSGIIPRDRLLHLQRKITENTHEPLRTLIRLPQSRFGGSQYADGWALIYFLFNDAQRGRPMIGKYWLLGCERQVTPEDFERLATQYYGGVDKLEEEYLAYSMSLRPEPPGRIDGNIYVSDDFKFELTLPGDDWEFIDERDRLRPDLPNRDSILVAMELPERSPGVYLRFFNNFEKLESAPFLKVVTDQLAKDYVEVAATPATVAHTQGFRLTYLDKEAPAKKAAGESAGKASAPDGKSGTPGPSADEAPVDQQPRVRNRYVAYLVPGIDKAYFLVCQASVEEFEVFLPEFELAAESFELTFQNRW